MKMVMNSLEFFIGAFTRADRDGNWVWPGRSIPFLYRRKFRIRTECSIEPNLETWCKYGLVVFETHDSGRVMMSVRDFVDKVSDEKTVKELLMRCPGEFLQGSKEGILDMLGCPRDAT